MTSSLEMEQG